MRDAAMGTKFVGTQNGPTILVVDDQGTSRAILGHMLHTCLSCNVVSFDNPMDALRWCEGHSFRVAVLDYHMPGMDGVMLARQLSEICPNCRIVLVTAGDMSELSSVASTCDAAICLSKSCGMKAIVEQCRNLL